MSNRFSVISRGFHLTYGYDVFHSVGDGIPDVPIFSEPSPIGTLIGRPGISYVTFWADDIRPCNLSQISNIRSNTT